jgi:hypothetical protein
MMRFYIFFRGTNNGELIFAKTMAAAKSIFAAKHGVPASSAHTSLDAGSSISSRQKVSVSARKDVPSEMRPMRGRHDKRRFLP